MTVLGIDPGKDGAAVVLRPAGVHGVLAAELLCGQSWEAAHSEVTRWVRQVHATWTLDLVVLERVGGRPGEGATSARTMGIGWGLWLGAVSTLGVPVLFPTPQRWQKALLSDLAGAFNDDPCQPEVLDGPRADPQPQLPCLAVVVV